VPVNTVVFLSIGNFKYWDFFLTLQNVHLVNQLGNVPWLIIIWLLYWEAVFASFFPGFCVGKWDIALGKWQAINL